VPLLILFDVPVADGLCLHHLPDKEDKKDKEDKEESDKKRDEFVNCPNLWFLLNVSAWPVVWYDRGNILPHPNGDEVARGNIPHCGLLATYP